MTTAPVSPAELVRFRVNGREVEAAVPGGRRLLDVLRVDLGLTGTKEGCGEGECGACSVLVDGVVVNSCLVPAAHVDRHEVVTIEGLADGDELDPLQQAFVACGGTQCGFCTPGMVLAAHALLARGGPVSEPEIREAVAGNLCRCTGYTKILDAIEDAAAVLHDDRGAGHAGPRPTWRVAVPDDPTPIRVAAAGGASPRLVRPRSLPDALARLAADPSLRPIAGGTDLMVELQSGAASPSRPLLDLAELDELRGIEVAHDELVLGALTTYTELRTSRLVVSGLRVLADAAAEVGAAQIQHRGTIGGNCVTASPAGDMLPVLLATEALMEVAGPAGTRVVPAAAFWTGYRRTALMPGELLIAIRIPLVPGRHVRFRKVGTRRAQAISKVVLAIAWQGGDPGGDLDGDALRQAGERGDRTPWHDVRVALGSVAEVPLRAPRAEAALEGGVAGLALADAAAEAVRHDIRPIDDVRSTADYRRAVAGRILRRIVVDAAG